MWLHVITNHNLVAGDASTRIWHEFLVQVLKVRHIDPDAGKTGRGQISFWKGPHERHGKDVYVGHHVTIDIEDIVDTYSSPALDIQQY